MFVITLSCELRIRVEWVTLIRTDVEWSCPLTNLTIQLICWCRSSRSLNQLDINWKIQTSKNLAGLHCGRTSPRSSRRKKSSRHFRTIWEWKMRAISILMFLFSCQSKKPELVFCVEKFWQIKSVGTNQRPCLTKECLQRNREGGIFNIHTRLLFWSNWLQVLVLFFS